MKPTMSSSDLEMSLEHQIPVMMDKTQMSGERGGPQCGLTSLLPMSCRGRAAAFARDLHSRLRNLGADPADVCDPAWLASDRPTTALPNAITPLEHDTFYDFELECASPSSPVDEIETFLDRSPTDDEPPFYDVDYDPDLKEQAKQLLQNKKKNGFKFSTSFHSDSSPVKVQPAPRENGHADKRLFSAITFEGVARQNSCDEIDSSGKAPKDLDSERVGLPGVARQNSCDEIDSSGKASKDLDSERLYSPFDQASTVDSDSEFESAKSDPSDGIDETVSIENRLQNNIEATEVLSLTDVEIPSEDIESRETVTDKESTEQECNLIPTEIVVTADKEVSPTPEIDQTLLNDPSKNNKNDEGEDDRPQRVRRCSSLKTGKTPPGTPGRKKIVRFADVLGLDLADVKTFMDEIPVIPKSAYDDLTGCDVASSPPARAVQRLGSLTLVPLFQLPRDFTANLEANNVCLESARVCDGVHVTICGSVRVRNLDFHKTVHVRYTMNHWRTYTDLQATYVQGSCDGFSDRFQFVLYAPCISSGQRLELAVRFQVKGQQFWDNNSGANYCFDCLALGGGPTPVSAPLHSSLDWHPSFY